MGEEKDINKDSQAGNKKTPKKEKDSEPFSEKLEDTLDDIVGGTQEFFYGKGDNLTEDIPAMMDHPSEIKRINKVQTRRNLNKKLFGNKTFLKVILIIFSIPLCISLITWLISLFM